MDPKVRRLIIDAFGNHASRSQNWLIEEIQKTHPEMSNSNIEITRHLGFMVETGDIQLIDNKVADVYRLTLSAVESRTTKIGTWLKENWIALVALCIAFAGLFT